MLPPVAYEISRNQSGCLEVEEQWTEKHIGESKKVPLDPIPVEPDGPSEEEVH